MAEQGQSSTEPPSLADRERAVFKVIGSEKEELADHVSEPELSPVFSGSCFDFLPNQFDLVSNA